MIRVRIAPSPTGIPHIGNTRTAFFNYLFAKHNKGKFILRIEDTDQKRIVKGAKEAIVEILNWLDIPPDEVYIQSERLSEYRKYARVLLEKGLAYEKDSAVWMRIGKNEKISWTDAVGNKLITFKSDDISDFVLVKSDGFPTYHLASVVDDHLLGITHVIRGDQWISATPKHILLDKRFFWEKPVFAHLPLILGPDKKKLSKRHGAKSVLDYRDEGYLKEALINFMALLGWNPGGDKEIITLTSMIKLFDLKDINSASPIFDIKKLEWMNGVYIRTSQNPNLFSQILARNPKLKSLDISLFRKFVSLAKTRMTTLNEFYDLIRPFIEGLEIRLKEDEKEIAKELLNQLSKIDKWQTLSIFAAMKKILEEKNVRMPVLYKILTGKDSGLPLPDALSIVGRERTLRMLGKILP